MGILSLRNNGMATVWRWIFFLSVIKKISNVEKVKNFGLVTVTHCVGHKNGNAAHYCMYYEWFVINVTAICGEMSKHNLSINIRLLVIFYRNIVILT